MFVRLSYEIDDNTPSYGGKNSFKIKPLSLINEGNSANTSTWEIFNHLGTHIDFPYHFYQNGQTIEDFPEDFWIFSEDKIQVLEVNLSKNELLIKPENINVKNLHLDPEILFFKTDYGKFRAKEKYWKYNPGLDIETVNWIKKTFKDIKIIGIDSISISSWQHRDMGRQVHRELLDPKNPILIIEDMNLSKINNTTRFKMIHIAPLFVSKADGSPCTITAEVTN